MNINFETFKWLNESAVRKEDNKIILAATPNSDFFFDVGNAPYYYTEMTGDFVWKAKVSLTFMDPYDSACFMVMADEKNWAKACLELTDFGAHAVVSVVTKNGESDDANGCNIDGNSVWLQVTKVSNSYAFHYSVDGESYYMMRFFTLPAAETVKVGLLAQAPTGNGGDRCFEELSVEAKTVHNIRLGN